MQHPPTTPLRRRAPSSAASSSLHTPSKAMTPSASPARSTRSHDKHTTAMQSASASSAAAASAEEESPASNQKENQTADTNANTQHNTQSTNDKQSSAIHSAHVPSIAASASSSSAALPSTPKSVSRKKKQARVIVPDFLGPATPSKNVDALPFHVAAAAAAAADQAAQQRLMLQQFSNGSNLGAGLSLEEEFNMVASTSGGDLGTLSAAEDLSLLSNPHLSAFHSPQRPLAYTPLRTPLHPVTAFTNNAHATPATSASMASNVAASSSSAFHVPAPAAPSLRSKQKLSFVAPSSSSGVPAAAPAPFKMALPDTYLKVLAGANNAFASSYPSAARAAARASASAAAAASSSLSSPPAVASSSILSPSATAVATSSASTWSNFNFSLHSFASTTSLLNQSQACSQLFASSSSPSSALPAAATPAASSVSPSARPLDEVQLKELVQQSLEQAGIESDVDGAGSDEDEDSPMQDASAAAPGLFGAPLPYAPDSFKGSMVCVTRKNRVAPAPFLTPERSATQAAAAAAPAAPASEPQIGTAQPTASPAAISVPSAPSSAPVVKSKRPRAPNVVPLLVPGLPLPVTTKRGVAAIARQIAAAERPLKPESLKVKRRKTPQFVNKAVQLVVDVTTKREKTDTLEAGMGLEMLTHGVSSPAHTPIATPAPIDLAASLYPVGFRRTQQSAPAEVPSGVFTAAQRSELRCQVQLHMQLLYQSHWLCSMLPTPPPPARTSAKEVKVQLPTPHAALAPISQALIEQMVDAAQGTTTTSVAPAAAAATVAATATAAPASSPDTSAQTDAAEHAQRLMLLMNASTTSPKSSSASVSDDATDDDEPPSNSVTPPISLTSVGPYARTTPVALPAQRPNKVLQVPAMTLWSREDCLRNLTFPDGHEAEQRKMAVIEEALEAEKRKYVKPAVALAVAVVESAKSVLAPTAAVAAVAAAANAPFSPTAIAAAAAAASASSSSDSAALSTPSAKRKRSSAAASASSASFSDSKQPRYLPLLPQSLVQSFWNPLLERDAPDASPSAAAAASAAVSSKSASVSPPNCYALDTEFFVRYLRNERHTFSTSEEHLWKLGLVSHAWGTVRAKLMALKNFPEILTGAVDASTAAYSNPNSGRRNDPNRRKLFAIVRTEESTVSLLTLIRRRFLPGKSLDQLQTKLVMQLMSEKKAMAMQPRMLIMPQVNTAAAGKAAVAKAAAVATAAALPQAFRPMPSQIAAAVEQDAEPLEAFEIFRTQSEEELQAAASSEQTGAAAAGAASFPFAPVLTLRDLTSTELIVVTKGLELHGTHRNKWSLISSQMLPYFPRKLLAKAWTKHQERLKGKAKAKLAAPAPTAQPDSPSSEVSQKKQRAVGGKKRKAGEGAVFDTMDLSAAPAQATPAERRRIDGGAQPPEEDFDTMEVSMDAEDLVEETAAQLAPRSAVALLSPQQPAVNQAAIKVPVGFTPAKPDQSSNQLAA